MAKIFFNFSYSKIRNIDIAYFYYYYRYIEFSLYATYTKKLGFWPQNNKNTLKMPKNSLKMAFIVRTINKLIKNH